MDNINDLIEWDNESTQTKSDVNNTDSLIEWDIHNTEPKKDINKDEKSGSWIADTINTTGNFILDFTGFNSLYDGIKELLGNDQKPDISPEDLARKIQQTEKANAQNTIKEHLSNVIYNLKGDEESLQKLDEMRIANANKIVDTLSNLTDMEIEARDYNGEIKYIAKDKDGKETEITQNWVKSFLGSLADTKGELILGTVAGIAGYKKGKNLGQKVGSIVEKTSGAFTKKIPFAGKYISKGLGKLADWSIRSIGSGGGAALGSSVGAFADTINAQFNIGQQLDLAKGVDNAEDALYISLATGVLMKPFFAGVSLSSKTIKELGNFIFSGNINGARGLLKANTNMSDDQIMQFTKEFENTFGNIKNMSQKEKEVYVLSLLPRNRDLLIESGSNTSALGTRDFLQNIGVEVTKKAANLYDPNTASNLVNQIAKSDLPKSTLTKAITKDTATAKSIADTLIKQSDSLSDNYSKIMDSLTPELRKNVEGMVIDRALAKHTTMINGRYGIDFTGLSKTLDSLKLTSKEAKEFSYVIKGSSKFIDNSFNILKPLEKINIYAVGSNGLSTNPITKLKTFLSNRFYKNILTKFLGDEMAVMANLRILLDKPMNKVAFDDLAKSLRMNKKEAEEIGKEFRENVIKQQELVKNIEQNIPMQEGQVLDNVANIQTKATYRTKKEDIFNMYPKETQFIKDYSTENSSQSTFSTSKDLVNSLLLERNPEADLNIIMDDLYKNSTKRTKDIISKLGRGLLKDTAIPKILQKDILKNKSILKNNGIIIDDIEATILTNQLIKDTAENNADTIAYKRALAELNKERYRKAKEIKNSNL